MPRNDIPAGRYSYIFRCNAVSALIVVACLVSAPVAHADPPSPIPEPVLPPLAPGQVLRIGPTAGTGTPTGDYGIGATDLCEFMEFPSGILPVSYTHLTLPTNREV